MNRQNQFLQQQQQQHHQQQHQQQQQQFQQQMQHPSAAPPTPPSIEPIQKKRTASKLISNNNRKRSHSSSSSTSSSGSPSTNIFSTASSSDSGSSTMTSIKGTPIKRKRNTSTLNGSSTDSSSAESGASSTPMPSKASSSSFASPSIIPPRLTAQRSVPAFLNKLYNMVEDLSTTDLIRWSNDGTSFIVEKHEEFAKTVLPRFYKHNTFASFVRQLNMYDFHKVPHLQQGVLIAEAEHEIWEFSNPHFQRGRPDLLVLVTRKRNRDRDAIDSETVTLSTLAQDLDALKKHQSTIGTELNDLHRDNEILWQETLNAREKYQRHQEAIEKILQFLTAIFANDNLAISANNADLFPKGLIEEAASLAGLTSKLDNAKKSTAPLPNSLASSALSNILSSVLRLYSNNSPSSSELPQSTMNSHRNRQPHQQQASSSAAKENSSMSSSSSSLYPQSPREKKEDATPSSLVDFSKTLNTATRSAQNITQDIDMLQVNIESLANDLGIDPNQFDDDAVSERCFQDNGMMNNNDSIGATDPFKIYKDLDSDQNMSHFTYTLQHPHSSVQYQQQRQQQQQRPQPQPTQQPQQQTEQMSRPPMASQMQSYTQPSPSRSNSMAHMQPPQQPQPQPPYSMHYNTNTRDLKMDINQTADGGYRQFISSMNYSDSFGPNYSSESDASNYTPTKPVGPPPHTLQQQSRGYFNCGNDDMMAVAAAAVAVGGPNGVSSSNLDNNAESYNTMYTAPGDLDRPPYYNGMSSGENYNDNT
ncbi:transcription factor hsf1 [Mucor ambiguus]|uniref:Transcription factor hsf1 n=1 Tax=Mucor ambiguus TaxID=91626 RepID=A0A0C9MSY3_9FUNG|nr:transcription factor hsf1 [Mucor ambiguus]